MSGHVWIGFQDFDHAVCGQRLVMFQVKLLQTVGRVCEQSAELGVRDPIAAGQAQCGECLAARQQLGQRSGGEQSSAS